MTISMYSAFIPTAVRMLTNLSAILAKAESHCEARKINPNAFLASRIYPDMFPLTRQVQIATDIAKGGAARLAGIDIPRYEDEETTFAELRERLARTVRFLEGIRPEQIDGKEDAPITLKLQDRQVQYLGQAYLSEFVLPNLFFHITTAYNLLRQGGVDIGKRDFLGG
ncbi:MAG: DUF1993 domain-containing protein [Aquabacterium sp.]